MAHPKHPGELARSGDLREITEIRGERYGIAALGSAREIRPSAGRDIDPEATELTVDPPRVERYILLPLDPAAGEPARQDGGQHG
jgi:hypothetical protein